MTGTDQNKLAVGQIMKTDNQAKSLTLTGAVAMGTDAMIGENICALTGQIAELAGPGSCLSK